jgi:ABC-type cobalamin/Fe3+-siderophores transport system ATPase subunit
LIFQLINASVLLGGKTILNNLNVEIPEKKVTYIAGLNGSGKTTLLNILNTQLPLSNGEVLFQGIPLKSIPNDTYFKSVTWVQQLNTQAFDFLAEEFILLGRFQHLNFLGDYTQQDFDLLHHFADKLGITPLLKQNLNHLSGGELQKIYLAQALVRQAPVLLLDEPSRFLDPFHRSELYALLNQLADEGMSIICVSHDQEVYMHSPAHIIGLKAGQVVWNQIVNTKNANAFRHSVYNIPIPVYKL